MRASVRADVRAVLKARTAHIHHQLETIPAMQRLLDGTLCMADYVQLLQGYRTFYLSAAANLALGYRQLRSIGFALPEKKPLALLDADLRALGGVSVPDDMVEIAAATAEQSVGWVWVAEGSALGGMVIDRALRGLFGERREGRRFFETQPDVSLRWQNVCTVIETYGHGEYRCEAMAEGALAAFRCVERSLLAMTP